MEGQNRPDQEEGLGRCVVHGCGEVSAEMSKVMVPREECQHFDRGERMTRTRKEEHEEEKGIMTKRRGGGHRNKGVRALDSGDGCKRIRIPNKDPE